MIGYRVTKFDPHLRDHEGRYSGDDWTSIADIGKAFGGAVLTVEDYLRIEERYLEAVRILMSSAHIGSMRVADLEMKGATASGISAIRDRVVEACRDVRNDQIVSGVALDDIIRGCLREHIWCRLKGRGGAYIHFGYDFYMYVGLPATAKPPALPPGIFLEECDSPYRMDEDDPD